jgi:effector-binding domain-containing protein
MHDAGYDIHTTHLTARPTVVVRGTIAVESVPEFLGAAYGAVMAYLGRIRVYRVGPPFARYQRLDGSFVVEAGFPVDRPVPGDGQVQPSSLPAGEAAVTVHVGPYEEMEPTYGALERWIREHDAAPAGAPWEVYLSPPDGDPTRIRTQIVQPFVAN